MKKDIHSTAAANTGAVLPQRRNGVMLRLFIMLILVFVLMTLLRPNIFLRPANFNSMMRQLPEYGIMAIGVSLAMMTGGIDLSIVSTANLSAIIAAKLLISQVPQGSSNEQVLPMIIVAVLLALTTGLLCGALTGFLIGTIGIPPMLATLGTQQLYTGVAIVLTSGRPQSRLPLLYSEIGNAEAFNFIPVSFLIFIVIAVLVGFILSRTKFGMQISMVGTNPKAAQYAGLNNKRIILKTYMLSGFLSSISGLIMMARANSAKADYGSAYTMQCVLIAVLGGISPNGGFGTIGGVTLAVFILQILSSGLNMFENVSNFYRDVVWGGVLILVLITNWLQARHAAAKISSK
ncbi:MAG: ABC transporter permease [Spirochaetaceae bacterium]|nr:ABC transporter permease [Spirochaetaceae bacterium]